MKVLVIGSGAREHALVVALSRDPMVHTVIAAPGNPGIDVMCETRPVDAADPQAVTTLAQECDASLVVIGPEAPLVAGVSDALRAAGIAVFGPSQAAAALEGSKAFAKGVMNAAKVPTAASVAATSAQEAREALTRFGAPHVVKADGSAAGKGVVVTRDFDEALDHAVACLEESDRVVIEDFLDGPEVSLFVVCDGTTAVPLAPAQDFKRERKLQKFREKQEARTRKYERTVDTKIARADMHDSGMRHPVISKQYSYTQQPSTQNQTSRGPMRFFELIEDKESSSGDQPRQPVARGKHMHSQGATADADSGNAPTLVMERIVDGRAESQEETR